MVRINYFSFTLKIFPLLLGNKITCLPSSGQTKTKIIPLTNKPYLFFFVMGIVVDKSTYS